MIPTLEQRIKEHNQNSPWGKFYRMPLNQLGATLFLSVLRKEISAKVATSILKERKKYKEQPCIVGAYGVCKTHGQLMLECLC